MKILAIDTSTRFLSVAVTRHNEVLATFRGKGELKQSELLIPEIDRALKTSGLKLKDIDGLAISIGPGSFTGLRIGVATFKAINMAVGIPIVAVPTLDVIAYNFINEEKNLLCPVVDAKKKKVYTCCYRSLLRWHFAPPRNDGCRGMLRKLTDYMLLDIDELLGKIKNPTLVFGDGAALYKERLKENRLVSISDREWRPEAEIIAKLGREKLKKRQVADPDKLAPMYLHSKYCQIRGSGGERIDGTLQAYMG